MKKIQEYITEQKDKSLDSWKKAMEKMINEIAEKMAEKRRE